jgi:hypothetical protein
MGGPVVRLAWVVVGLGRQEGREMSLWEYGRGWGSDRARQIHHLHPLNKRHIVGCIVRK